MPKKEIITTRAELAESILYLDGSRFSLQHYPFLPTVYNCNADDIVLKFSRQTAKSTTLANLMLINSVATSFFRTLYVSPTVDQTKVFSNDRVAPSMEGSPVLKDYYMSTTLIQNVFTKQFLNGSKIYLRYALLTADRLRGISADMNVWDECQDIRADIIPVVRETMSRSMYKRSIYAGTPKRTQGTLADLWNRSTKNEYAIKCTGCNYYNILDEDNIGLKGPICKKCGKQLAIANGEWVSAYDIKSSAVPTVEGFRVCLLHFHNAPWVDWNKDVIYKHQNTKKAYFYNEVLAMEYDEGASPVTLQDVINACDPEKKNTTTLSPIERSYPRLMGIDYGPINSEDSHTVTVVMQKRNDTYYVLFAKKFKGKEADYSYIHREVPRLMTEVTASHLAADWGMGEASNSEIRARVGYEKVIAFQHLPAQKEKARWNAKIPAYTLNRNQVMNEFFEAIRKGKLVFPNYDEMKDCVRDIMNVQMEFDEERNSMKYINIGADDFVHACIYCMVALDLYYAVM